MYVDSTPMSTYAKTQGWNMPNPQPSGLLKRPPLLSNGSSSSSLSGMEQTVPSFQSFLNRTPPLDHQKPLPPTPLIPRRASSGSPPMSRTPSAFSQRRSSSVYSRTVSQWFDEDSSWRSVDLRDDLLPAMPPLPILQPVAYSVSTSQLIERPTTPPPPMLEPRSYRPLLTTPSPTASRAASPVRSPPALPAASPGPPTLRQPQHAIMYRISPPSQETSKKQIHTVSLEKAQAAVRSPRAMHLLPEELRAQQLGKSKSHDVIRVDTCDFFDGFAPSRSPQPPECQTLVEHRGRSRSFQGPKSNVNIESEYPFPVMNAPAAMPNRPVQQRTDTGQPRLTSTTHRRQASKTKVVQPVDPDNDGKPRGRTKQRGPRSADHSYYMPQHNVASGYHTLLSEPHRQPSSSPAYNSDDSVRAHVKMVPQPLFKYKPGAKVPGLVSRRASGPGSSASESAIPLRAISVASETSSASCGSFPVQLSLAPESTHRRMGTTGSIPISPPMNASVASHAPARDSPSAQGIAKEFKRRRRNDDNRASMYYPYIGSRIGKRGKVKQQLKRGEGLMPPMPLLPADVIARKLKTPDGSVESSSLRSTPPVGAQATGSTRKQSNASSDRPRTPLLQRLAGNAVKYADSIMRTSGMPEAHPHHQRPSEHTAASPNSPHLLTSPVKTGPPPSVHLGWSDSAKVSFDRARSSIQSSSTAASSASPWTPQSSPFTRFTDYAAPARPLDESRLGLREPENPSRQGSLLGGLLDGWKERKKEERREELKKNIRVIPQPPPPQMATRDVIAPGLFRQASMGAGPAPGVATRRPISEGLARRMSALGWM